MAEFHISEESLTPLKDKVVLITGSSSGIGKATVQLCLHHGAKVIAGDINPFPADFLQEQTSPEALAHSPEYHSQNLLFIQTDVSNWSSIRNLFTRGLERFGGIDHVFANAGIGPRTNFLEEVFEDETKEEQLLAPPDLKVLEVNLIGTIYTVRLGVHYLRRSEQRETEIELSPSITVTASASAFQDFAAGDYTVAKHGVLGILRGLYSDLRQPHPEGKEWRSVRLNAIAPSWTATGIAPGDVLRSLGAHVQEPEYVARSVVMLFNDKARNGELIYSWEGRYCEINRCAGGLLDGVARVVRNVAEEGSIMEKWKGR
ncbi:uncharacterized protein DSM5745_08276 [Aspergillus mulundensis]|uniref:Uncharacterized protein n=1 Tax=Aspergillus mulundensis TaxID=1810919 RepID=A0A3D8R9Q9_9EURO|nr:Uncharacterized protein DSM5745_08276 [Aspergillus mulundensis]RDW70765.1 Uncharacterized protein DSM5745_08276 [Aspergillus mulundensis]